MRSYTFFLLIFCCLSTLLVQAQNSLPSQLVSFNGYTGDNLSLIQEGWFESVDSSLFETDSEWTADDFGNDPMNSNGRAARLRLEIPEMDEWILSPFFVADAFSFCLFDVQIKQAFSQMDGAMPPSAAFEVLMREEASAFASIWELSAGALAENENWLSLPVDSGSVFQLAFRAKTESDFGIEYRELFLDNIRLLGLPEIDLEMVEMISPFEETCYGEDEQVVIQIRNVGATTLDLAQLNATLNWELSSPISNEEFSQDLSAFLETGQSVEITLDSTVDMSSYGSYLFDFDLQLEGDLVDSNNVVLQYRNYQEPAFSLLDTFDFDNYLDANLAEIQLNWEEARGFLDSMVLENSLWSGRYFVNDFESPNGNSAYINLFNTEHKEWLLGPKFRVTDTAVLEYDLALTEFSTSNATFLGSDDVFAIYAFVDCDMSPIELVQYNSQSIISPFGTEYFVDLSAFSGQDIRIGFYASDGQVDDPEDVDLFLDNVAFTGLLIPPPDAGASDVWQIEDRVCAREAQWISTLVQNFSAAPLTDFEVYMNVSGIVDTSFSQHVDIVVAGYTYYTVFFGDVNTTEGGELHLTTWVVKDGDILASNDTLVETIEVVKIPEPDLGEDRAICFGEPLSANWLPSDSTTFLWFDGSLDSTRAVLETATYIVSVDEYGCVGRDTAFIEALPLAEAEFDYEILDTGLVNFQNNSIFADTVYWFLDDGSTANVDSSFNHQYVEANLYEVQLVAENQCNTDTVVLQVPIVGVAVEELSAFDFEMFPVPVSDFLHVKTAVQDGLAYQLFDLNGKAVSFMEDNKSGQSFTIDLRKLSKGIYFLRLNHSGESISKKFLIDR